MFNVKPYDCVKSSHEIKQWYEENYHLLSRGGLWLKGGEPNTMDPALFARTEVRFLICRLSTYRDVSASISHGLVAQIAQEVEGVFTDFAFLPPPKDMEVMTTSNIPLWVGATTKEPPCAFDVLGISNSFVLELLNLPKLLLASGIPLFKNERMDRRDIPFVVLGGANAAATAILHGPLNERGFGNGYGLVDAVFIGEGEFSVKQFLEIVKQGKSLGWSKTEILHACHGRVDGFYEPDKYEHCYKSISGNFPETQEAMDAVVPFRNQAKRILAEIVPKESYVSYPVKSAVVYDLDQVRTLESGPIWYESETIGTGILQISNGCPCFCSFCAESWERKPYRERSLIRLLDALKRAKAQQGLDTVNLSSFNFNTHAELYPMILSFFREITHISLKSQRFDLLSTDRFLAEVQQIIGKTTVSCGMEGISERLRRYLHKNLTEEQIYKACEFLFEKGVRELKVFLIHTGLEQDEDLLEFGRFVKRLGDLKSMTDCKVRIIFSLTPLYYPPHTPLQFHACLTSLEKQGKMNKAIEHICRFNGMEFRESASYEETWLMQLLAMGDRRLTPALIRSSITDGFVYYNTVPKNVLKNWRTYLMDLELSEEYYFCEKGKGHVFPWGDIDPGISKKFLWEEYERSVRFTEREYCLGRPRIDAKCLGCGACPSGADIQKITQHKSAPSFLMDELRQIEENKRKLFVIEAVVEVEDSLRLAPKRHIGVSIARALMLAIPEIAPYYHSLSGHLREAVEDKVTTDTVYGIDVYRLSFVSTSEAKRLATREYLSCRLDDIQQKCQGFKIREFITDSCHSPDVKYMLYRIYFDKIFTAAFIRQKLGEYFTANYVKHTLFRRGDHIVFKTDTKHKKNAVVLYARIDSTLQAEKQGAEFSLVMLVSTRFEIQPFLEICCGFGKRRESIRTKIEALGYYGKNPVLQTKVKCSSCNDSIHETLLLGRPLEKNLCLVCSIDRGGLQA